jgi:outer membrane protein assembly factor BamB
LNALSGAVVWSYTTGALVESSPAVANGLVYVGSNDHEVYALDAASGAVAWSFTTGDDVESSPIVDDGTVYVGSDDGSIDAFALSGLNGARTARHPSVR